MLHYSEMWKKLQILIQICFFLNRNQGKANLELKDRNTKNDEKKMQIH